MYVILLSELGKLDLKPLKSMRLMDEN